MRRPKWTIHQESISKTDDQGRIIRCEGEYTLPSNLDGWVLIEEGPPCDRLNLAQTHYFGVGLCTDDGIPRYKLEDVQAVARTDEEIEADRAALPKPGLSGLTARVEALEEITAAIERGLST